MNLVRRRRHRLFGVFVHFAGLSLVDVHFKLFKNPTDSLLLDLGDSRVSLRHDPATRSALFHAIIALSILITLATRVLWTITRPGVPWFAFRRLGLLTSLALLPLFISYRHVLFASNSHFTLGERVNILESVATVWNFLTGEEKLYVLSPLMFLDLYMSIEDSNQYDRERVSTVIVSCIFDGPAPPRARRMRVPRPEQEQPAQEAPEEDPLQQDVPVQEVPVPVQEPDPIQPPEPEEEEEIEDPLEGIRQRLQCSVCLDLLRQPYITSCGHVFDLVCLGSWFLNAPPFEDMDHDLDPADPDYTYLRSKTCPFCRSILDTPPIRHFSLESVLEYIGGEEEDAHATPVIENPVNEWRGIFFPFPPLPPQHELVRPHNEPAQPHHEPAPQPGEPAEPLHDPAPPRHGPAQLHHEPAPQPGELAGPPHDPAPPHREPPPPRHHEPARPYDEPVPPQPQPDAEFDEQAL
ncbi:hypothetical protein B0H11DRAFT_655530 [Mycena galericulata]|nr:hypothetical protein B0H11DRAFT_655530 [Mycena galericulata]